ncbi:LuxR C-terminal-related transcriptional regulator [Streptomyces sp. NPDC058067]|uniref:helix-turn-helix transcriptional regulator n=1 Tax=Streptomyces sp. NPDC058067 TaxID=3346324 RepID=UPI0036EF27CF
MEKPERFPLVYVGGLTAVVPPAVDAVLDTARAAAAHSVLAVDPNVRQDRTVAVAASLYRLRQLCALAHVVKASDEDAALVWPGRTPEAASRTLADEGRLVVLILRAFGADCYGRAPLADGQRDLALELLDRAWDEHHRMDARVHRDSVQHAMRETGARRKKWPKAVGRPKTGWASLTAVEQRVALLIADGHSDRSAADKLGVSVHTVGTHLRMAFSKLGVQSRVQLANSINRTESPND